MTQIWALRSRLEKQPTDLLQYTSYFGDRTLATGGLAKIEQSSLARLARFLLRILVYARTNAKDTIHRKPMGA
jgi:hypothetical protein